MISEKVQYHTWTCKDGRVLRIIDMTDEHIVNAIRMLERKAENDYNHQDISHTFDISEVCIMDYEFFLHPNYEPLVAEAKKRGIKL